MNNLKLYSEISLNLDLLQPNHEEESILFSAFDIERNRLFFASSANIIYTTYLSSFQNGRIAGGSVRSLPAEACPLDLDQGDFVTAFDYVMEKEALVLGTGNGALLLHNVDENVTEVVGHVEGGVVRIAPSPDGDLLAIVSGVGQVLVMTHDWDLLYEFAMEEDRGALSGGDVKLQDVSDYSISWRGDGKYFATLSDDCNSSPLLNKRLRVWERDSGTLLATSDSKEFMGAVLEWMPSGAKIAVVHDRKAENCCPEIAFYERNGLFRNSFSINEPVEASVQTLRWNCHSDLLASVVRCDKHDAVKIWFFSNNCWYLKHEIRYSKQDGVKFMWDPIKPLRLFCWTLGGQVTIFNFVWTTAVMDNSTALVIDDSKVLVTPLALSLMPPPLHLFSLKFSSALRDVALYSRNAKNCVAAFLSDGCLSVVELPEPETWEELEGKEFNVEACTSETVLGSLMHLAWLDSHILIAVSHYGYRHSNYNPSRSLPEDGSVGFYLQEIEFMCSENHVPSLVTGSGWHANVSCKNSLEGSVIGVTPNPAKKHSAFIQFDGGNISEYTSKPGLSIARHDMTFSSSCPWMSVALVNDIGVLKPMLFGLDDLGRLLVGGKVLCNNCNSFSFYTNLADQVITHLILTTKQDCLFVVNIDDILHGETEQKYGNFIHTGSRQKDGENVNLINIWERGARIIGVLDGDDSAVIMQTPRGNLECIYPRRLVLSSIINALFQKRFRDALSLVRRHRIDFNVMVDYCGWQAFLQSASEFVKQVDSLSHITEFVCAMKNENVMETQYKHHVSLPSQKRADEVQLEEDRYGKNKVSSVLLAIRKALEDIVPETSARELCILTTLARSDPPALEEALERVKSIREMELLGSNYSEKASYPSAEEALKHLLWLSDSEAVFEAALGLYDLNLAAIVALNSQRDPKEFLPYLKELERMPSLIMRYNIDLRLRRVEKALKHIVSAGDTYFSDCMNLLSKNPQLFGLALQLIMDPAKRVQVLEAWGDHLTDEKCYEDAATTYLCCSSLEKACKAYRACGNWSGVLTVAGLLKLGKDDIMQLAHELCEELQALGKPGEAAKIALEYCRDVNSGISLLISARDWEEALRVAFMHTQDNLVAEVKNASFDCATTLIGEYEESLEKVGKYLTRYLAVRQRRLLLVAKLQSEERSANDLDDDTISETSSNLSGMSAYTTGTRKGSAASVSSSTSKARDSRRQRNRGKIRPGSPGEELALVEHLKSMSLTAGAKRELKSLLASLVMLGNEGIARKLQSIAENFQVSQMAAVKLAEDAISSDIINEHAYTLERYIQKTRTEPQTLEALSWRPTVFISP